MTANQFLTAKDIAKRFQVSLRVVYLWVDRGSRPTVRVGPRLIRFTELGVNRFIHGAESVAT